MGILSYLKSIFTSKNKGVSKNLHNELEITSLEVETKVEEPKNPEELVIDTIESKIPDASQDIVSLEVKEEVVSPEIPKVKKKRPTRKKQVKVDQSSDKKSEKPKRSTKKSEK